MCTVKELKEYLNTLPDDMEVEVLEGYDGGYYTGTRWVSLYLGEWSDTCNVLGESLCLGNH